MRSIEATRSARRSSVDTWLGRMLPSEESALVEILLGGGVKEPGWQNTQLSKSRLAVVPGYSHYNFISSPEVPQIVGKFLADPLTNPPSGAAAASQAAPAPGKTK